MAKWMGTGNGIAKTEVNSNSDTSQMASSQKIGCCTIKKENSLSKQENNMEKHRIYTMPFAKVYPMYVAKAERKGRTKAEVDEIIRWLTGYSQKELEAQIEKANDLETFFAQAPLLNPKRTLITGIICGVRVEDIEDPLMQKIRYVDKLIDELARGKEMEKILRK